MAILLLGLLAAGCGDDDTSEDANGPSMLVAVAPNETSRSEPSTAIRLIDLATNESREIGGPAYYRTVRFSPDGQYLAAVGADTRTGDAWVRMYEVESGEEVASTEALREIAGISWSPMGRLLAIVGDGVVLLRAGEEGDLHEGVGAAPGANPLSWAWTGDGEVFAMVLEPGLVLMPAGEEAGALVERSDFPGDGADWGLRPTTERREIGLVDLRPVAGIAEGGVVF